jgi:5-carboxymethyl-2-hydroxymuconate isomerase
MPHCIIEYSEELNKELKVNQLMSAVFTGAVQSLLFTKADIKVRVLPYEYFYTEVTDESIDNKQRFIHVCYKILSGRTQEQRQKLSRLVLSHLNQLKIIATSISVEIVDMERESYNKKIN